MALSFFATVDRKDGYRKTAFDSTFLHIQNYESFSFKTHPINELDWSVTLPPKLSVAKARRDRGMIAIGKNDDAITTATMLLG